MSRPRRHHFNPQFYLKLFTDSDGLLSIYDFERNEVRRQNPAATCSQRDLYAFTNENGETDYSTIETMLSEFENESKVAIERLVNGAPPSLALRADLALFVALQSSRTPTYSKMVEETAQAAMRAKLRASIRTVDETDEHIRSYEAATGNVINESAEVLRERLLKTPVRLKVPKNYILERFMKTALETRTLLLELDCRVFVAPDQMSFVTSDDPYTLVPLRPPHEGEQIGFLSHGTMKVMPLTATHCIAYFDKGVSFTKGVINRGGMRIINHALASNAARFLISRDLPLARSLGGKIKNQGRAPIWKRGVPSDETLDQCFAPKPYGHVAGDMEGRR